MKPLWPSEIQMWLGVAWPEHGQSFIVRLSPTNRFLHQWSIAELLFCMAPQAHQTDSHVHTCTAWMYQPPGACEGTFLSIASFITQMPRQWQWWLALGLTWGARYCLLEMGATPENPVAPHGESLFPLLAPPHPPSLQWSCHLWAVCSACRTQTHSYNL